MRVCFCPLEVFFFVYNNKNSLILDYFEVKNTFGEQHTYVFRLETEEKTIENNCKKSFHLPFMDLESSYYFKILYQDKLSVVIDQKDEEEQVITPLKMAID